MRTLDLIQSDLYRYNGSKTLRVFLKAYLMNRGFNYMLWFRLTHAGVPILSAFASIILRFKQRSYGIEILAGTSVGHGLYIGHGGPVIIQPTAKIGNNVNLSQFVTIGSNHGKAAVVGNNVYIGPNCVLVEDITIGNNVTIGAGSIVLRSIPDNCIAAGNPARILNQNNAGRYCTKRWPPET